MLRNEPPSLRKISLALSGLGVLNEFRNIRRSFFNHRSCEIPILSLKPGHHPVFNRTAFSALIELREEPHRVLSVLEIRPVEPRPVVMGNELAVEMEMLVEATPEIFEP